MLAERLTKEEEEEQANALLRQAAAGTSALAAGMTAGPPTGATPSAPAPTPGGEEAAARRLPTPDLELAGEQTSGAEEAEEPGPSTWGDRPGPGAATPRAPSPEPGAPSERGQQEDMLIDQTLDGLASDGEVSDDYAALSDDADDEATLDDEDEVARAEGHSRKARSGSS